MRGSYMQVVLYRVTARRTKTGLKTIKREVLGATGDDPDKFLDSLARILAEGLSAEQIRMKGVAEVPVLNGESRAGPG